MVLEAPTDHPRPSVQSFRGTTSRFSLSPQLADGVRSLANREGCTLFMTLLAAFNALLHRYTAQQDLVVGIPVAGREHPALAQLVGFFVNSLPIRTQLAPDTRFRDLLARVRQASLQAFSLQEVPLEKIIEAVQPPRDLSRSPLFQVMFMLQSDVLRTLQLPGLEFVPHPVDTGTAKYDLSLIVTDRGSDGLVLEFEYNTDLFDARTIEHAAGHFENLLTSAVANPDDCDGWPRAPRRARDPAAHRVESHRP